MIIILNEDQLRKLPSGEEKCFDDLTVQDFSNIVSLEAYRIANLIIVVASDLKKVRVLKSRYDKPKQLEFYINEELIFNKSNKSVAESIFKLIGNHYFD